MKVDGTGADIPTAVVADTEMTGADSGKGGDITIHAGYLGVLGGASEVSISTRTFGSGPGGTISINVADAMIVDGKGSAYLTGVGADTLMTGPGSGTGGDIAIHAGSLKVRGGADISTSTEGAGPGGTISINVANALILDGTGANILTGVEAETAMTDSGGGKGGDIEIRAGSMNVLAGAAVNATTFGSGPGGTISINVADAMLLNGTGAAAYSTGVMAETGLAGSDAGKGGDITIQAGSLKVLGGAWISSSTFRAGPGGTISVNVADALIVDGTGAGSFTGLSAVTGYGGGKGGDITLQAGSLKLFGGAGVDTGTWGSGVGGNASLRADNVLLRGSLISVTSYASGVGGTVSITSGSDIGLYGSVISAQALQSYGGNITLTAPGVVDLHNSTITGQAGIDGGQITIDPRLVTLNHSVINGVAGGTDVFVTIHADELLVAWNSSILTSTGRYVIDTQFAGSLARLVGGLARRRPSFRSHASPASPAPISALYPDRTRRTTLAARRGTAHL